ncbi:unnamed protein product, partial [marine sediment metagenome]
HPKLPGEVYALADDCRLLKRYEDARQLWQRVVDNCPDSNDVIVMKSRIGIITADINLGDNPNVLADVNELIADYNDQPGLCQAVFRIGEEYYNKAFQMENEGIKSESEDCFQKAVAVWEKIIPLETRTSYPAQAYCFSGHCYRKLGEYEKSTAYYQYVVANYPEHRTAWQALFRVAHNYEDMKDLGIISKTEADPVIKAAYRQLLEKYPDCKMARVAQRWLSRHNSK